MDSDTYIPHSAAAIIQELRVLFFSGGNMMVTSCQVRDPVENTKKRWCALPTLDRDFVHNHMWGHGDNV